MRRLHHLVLPILLTTLATSAASGAGRTHDIRYFITGLVAPGGTGCIPTAINDQGVITGRGTVEDPQFGFVKVGFVLSNGTLTSFSTSSDPDNIIDPAAVNASGEIVGTTYVPREDDEDFFGRAFLYRQGIATDFLALGTGVPTFAEGINDAGQIVGTIGNRDSAGGFHAFLFANGKARNLGTIRGFTGNSSAEAINARGDVAGTIFSADERSSRAFLYSKGRMINLGVPAPQALYASNRIGATALNNKGDVVGNLSDGQKGPPFIASHGTIENLQTLINPFKGWQLYKVVDINDAGVIIGEGRPGKGAVEGFILTPVPQVHIAGPARVTTSRSQITLHGTASGRPDRIVTLIGHFRLHRGGTAIGTTHWHATFPLKKGINYLHVEAIVTLGASPRKTVIVTRR